MVANSARGQARNRWSRAAVWLPVALALASYAPTLNHGFVWDDVDFIVENPAAHRWGGIAQALSHGYGWVPGANQATNESLTYFRPLIVIANATQWILSAGRPWLFHLSNVATHAITSGLLGGIAIEIGLSSGAALAAAGLFAVHPAYAEAVAWISARTDGLAALFGALTLLLLLRIRTGGRIGGWMTGLALLFSLGAKESGAALLPVCVLTMLTSPLDRDRAARRVLPWLVGAAVLYLALRVLTLGADAFGGTRSDRGTLAERLLQGGALFACYLGRLVVPWPSSTEPPPFVASATVSTPSALLGFLLMAGAVASLAWSLRARRHPRGRAAAIGLLLGLSSILPVLQWVPTGEVYGERFLYLPALGLFLALAAACDRFLARRASLVLALLGLPAIAILETRLPAWKSDVSLFRESVRLRPESARAQFALGSALMDAGQPGPAEVHLRAALDRDSTDPLKHAQLGALLVNMGRVDEGVGELEWAERAGLRSRVLLKNLGLGWQWQNRDQEAGAALEKALAIDPNDPVVLDALGTAKRRLGRFEEAAVLFRRAIEVAPGRKGSYLNLLSLTSMELKDAAATRALAQQFLARFPGEPEAGPVRQLLQAMGSSR